MSVKCSPYDKQTTLIALINWASEMIKLMIVSEPLAKMHLAAMLCYALEVRAMVIRIAVPGISKGIIEGTIEC